MHEAVTFDSYTKVTDTLCYLGSKCVLNFVVSLGYDDKKGNRSSPVIEYLKKSDKYSNVSDQVYVKRNYRGYLSFEYKDPYSEYNKSNVYIYEKDIIPLRDILKKFNKSLDKAFAVHNNELCLTTDAARMNYKTRFNGMENIILSFTPTLLIPNSELDGNIMAGVNILFNNSIGINITMDRWGELLYILLSVNIPMMAMTMISGYASATMGKNIVDIDVFESHQTMEVVDKETMDDILKKEKNGKLSKSEMSNFFLNSPEHKEDKK